jgi:histidine ammonia-lyase
LAHIALALIGEGEVLAKSGSRTPSAGTMQAAGLRPMLLQAKEGLALINGTHLMGARGALLVADTDRLLDAAFVACAMSIDACKGTDAFLDERVYAARNQPGPAAAAARLRALLAGSTIIPSHRENDPRVQDPYSLRCAPVILGAALDALGYVKRAVEAELGAVTDNPLVFTDEGEHGPIVSAGNFHGMPVAVPLDVLAIAIAHVAGVSERRTFYLLSATDPVNKIPAYLSPRPGLHSGLMIAQYTAAACCNEIQGLAVPASIANIPTSAGMEDYNSFGPRAAAKAARSLELARSAPRGGTSVRRRGDRSPPPARIGRESRGGSPCHPRQGAAAHPRPAAGAGHRQHSSAHPGRGVLIALNEARILLGRFALVS